MFRVVKRPSLFPPIHIQAVPLEEKLKNDFQLKKTRAKELSREVNQALRELKADIRYAKEYGPLSPAEAAQFDACLDRIIYKKHQLEKAIEIAKNSLKTLREFNHAKRAKKFNAEHKGERKGFLKR